MTLTNKMQKNSKRQTQIKLSKSMSDPLLSAKKKRCKISTHSQCLRKWKYQRILLARKGPLSKLQSLLKNNKLQLKRKLSALNQNQLLMFLCAMKKRRKNHPQLRITR